MPIRGKSTIFLCFREPSHQEDAPRFLTCYKWMNGYSKNTIYPARGERPHHVEIAPPDPGYSSDCNVIKTEPEIALQGDGALYEAVYLARSTAIPQLAVKPTIEIVIVVRDMYDIPKVKGALGYAAEPGCRHIGTGGFQGYESFKLNDSPPTVESRKRISTMSPTIP